MSVSSFLMTLTMRAFQVWICAVCLFTLVGFAAPFDPEAHRKQMEELRERMERLRDLPGLNREEYARYWEEAMKNDPRNFDRVKDFRRAPDLRGLNLDKLGAKHPLFGDRLARASDDVRSRLDEARRVNVEEMRQLQRLQALRDDNLLKDGDWMAKREAMRENLPPRFTDEDIQARLKEQKRVMEELDQRRKEEFKRYEMQMEHARRQKLKEMNEKQRLEAEERYRQQQEALKQHEKLKHPASKEQLEDVWENEDGFNKEAFNPKTFFHLHDKNGDKHLDSVELEALFYTEIRKAYPGKLDGMEAHEDLARMREHAMREMDINKDGMVSLPEFMGYADKEEFNEQEEWKPIVDEPLFSEEEMQKFEDDYEDYYDYIYDEHGNIVDIKTRQKGVTAEPVDGEPSQPNEQEQPRTNEQEQPQTNEHEQPQQEQAPVIPEIPHIDDPKAVHIEGVNPEQVMDKKGDEEAPDNQINNQAEPGQL